jgi:FtsP/CotA-like multicopper oxidase with cupredoxin domain
MRLRFDGLKPYVAAIDGQPTAHLRALRASVPFAPGSRYDFLMDLPEESGASAASSPPLDRGSPCSP